MPTSVLSLGRVRELAAIRPAHAKVLSIYVDLDPREFGTAPARATALNAVLDQAERRVRALDGLDHETEVALREDVERVRTALGAGLDLDGARGLAVFACGPAGLLDVLRVPRPVLNAVHVDDAPHLDQLAALATDERWAVALVNARLGRILIGTCDGLEELGRADDDTPGRHDQGGWSQARYQRSIDKDRQDHVRHVADELFELSRAPGFDRLLIGAPEELWSDVAQKLHPYVKETLAGRVELDVETANADQVLAAARPAIEEYEREREHEWLERLRAGIARNERAVSGLADTLEALFERRVEGLLADPGLAAPGVRCPRGDWLGPEGTVCPLHEIAEPEQDIVERAREAALMQAAVLVAVRHHDDLGPLGGIAAVLRF
jgi:peptide subunit release factor 1 (eRF1)